MTKLEFLFALRDKLSGLPHKEVEERLNFYSEMIEDRMEEGLSEEDAVSAVGNIDEIAAHILSENPAADYSGKNENTKRKMKVWEILLLALGSPIWISLLIAALAIIISVYAALWSVVISLWAVFGSLIGCAAGVIIGGTVFVLTVNIPSGIAMAGAGFVCAGLSVFMFFGCKAATKGTLILAKKLFEAIKHSFKIKEDA